MEQVETATVGHFLHSGFMDRELRAVLPEKRIGGTAVTVRLPHADSTILHYLTKLVRPGDFIVVDRCGDNKHACWGGVVTHSMKLGGIVGAVIDGPATDFSEIRRVDLPMWCRGPSPITTKILGLEGAINVPVSVGARRLIRAMPSLPTRAACSCSRPIRLNGPSTKRSACSRASSCCWKDYARAKNCPTFPAQRRSWRHRPPEVTQSYE